MVTKENFEDYAILYVDKELTKEEEMALLAFVEQHPEYQQELNLYKASIIDLDTQVQFIDKGSLYKEEKTKVIGFNTRYIYYAAASIIALLFLVFYKKSNDSNIPIASNTTATTTKSIENKIFVPQPSKTIAKVVDTIKPHNTKQVPIKSNTIPRADIITLAGIPTTNHYTILDDKQPQFEQVTTVEIPEYIANDINIIDNETANNKISNLFAITETTRGMAELGKLANKKIDHIKDVTAQLKGSDVVLQLGKKEILIVKL